MNNLHSATVRHLERDGLIERDPNSDEDPLWRVSPDGEALLRENKQYLEPAGREAALIGGRHMLAQVGIQVRKPDLIEAGEASDNDPDVIAGMARLSELRAQENRISDTRHRLSD